MFVLVKTNDFYSADNINGRIQTEIFPTYKEAYRRMRNEVVKFLRLREKSYKEYLRAVLDHMEYTNVYLGKYEARCHGDYGELNNYWKIVEV